MRGCVVNDPGLQIDELRRELARLHAVESARGLVYGYARALDRLDRELLAAQFWPDAQVDYGEFYRGDASGFLDVALGFQGSMRDTQHLVGNICVQVHGGEASAESYVHAHHTIVQGEDLVQLLVGARYLDRFACRDGEWRISFRTEVIDWGRWLPVAERWFEHNEEMPKGLRGREDLSYRFLPPRGAP